MQRLSTYATGLAALAFFASWLLPGHYWPWLSFQLELAAALGALLIGVVVLVRAPVVVWPALSLWALTCALIPLVQWQMGVVRFFSDALLSCLFVAGFALCIVAGANLVKTRNGHVLAAVFGAVASGAVVSVGLALLQWQSIHVTVFFDGAPRGSRAWANLGQPNHLASLLAMGVCASLFAFSRTAIGRLTTVVLLCWLGLGLILTQSRTGYAFVLLLAAGLLAFRRRAQLPIHPLAVIGGAALFFLAVTFWPALNAALEMGRPMSLGDRVTGGTHRWTHWQVISDAILQRPWWGYGWTQVALAQHAALANHPASGEVLSSSHNIVLDLLVWNGLPIGLAIVAYATWWFVRQFRHCDSAQRFFAMAIVCALTLHAMVEFPLQYAHFLLPFGLAIGALEGEGLGSRLARWQPPKAVFAALWAASAVMTGWIAVEYMEVESTSRTLRFVSMGIGVDKVSHAPEPEVILLDRPKSVHRFMLSPSRVDADPAYLDWVGFMATRHATPSSMLRYAIAAGRNGRPEESAQALVRFCKLFVEQKCDQGRAAWVQAQASYPELASIPFPASSPPSHR